MLAIVPVVEEPARFAKWREVPGLSAIEAYPTDGAYGRRFFPAVYGDRRRDVSFAVTEDDEPLLLTIATAGDGELDWFGRPIRIFFRADLSAAVEAAALRTAFMHLDALAEQHRAQHIRVQDDGNFGALSALGEQCLNRHAAATLHLAALADLTGGETGLRRDLRKSFKSLINWGRRNLSIAIVARDSPDRALFDRYQDFHLAVAGRKTRPQASWDAIYEWITAGGGELVLGSLDGALVSGTLIIYGASVAHYASGVYDRTRFDKPLAHWPLWLSMLHSAERNLPVFNLGEIPLPGTVSDKEIKIGFFKRGFATRIASWLEWRWQPNATAGVTALAPGIEEDV